ncbi:ADP-ribosyl cyclase/cyclic ADP-ribose hydrolase-like [Montipora foliosa]|uniref:ADP-ribosyl cyclase/cyclic ADP-ribose hydrolase-like n=1 Tax=Montipora foliosa TaxID=591990 RepID=UPI0035F1B3D6
MWCNQVSGSFRHLDKMHHFRVLFTIVALRSGICLSFAEEPLGSTRHLKDIVLGRCWDFIRQHNNLGDKNCSRIWDKFYSAFAYKDPCSIKFDEYRPYFEEVGMDTVKPNKSLFWSGTYRVAHVFSDFGSLVTLEDTMAGWIVNGLTWCGSQSKGSDGINYTSCPQTCDYKKPFWGQASLRFAKKASGVVQVLVNGARVNKSGDPIPAYGKRSYFAQFELPNMRKEMVTKLLVLVMHSIGSPDLETCKNGSIKLLQEDAKRYGIKTVCYDDPNDIEHLLCAEQPAVRECLFFKDKKKKQTRQSDWVGNWIGWKGLAISMSSVVVILVAAVVGQMIHKKRGWSSPFGYKRQS